MSKADMVRAYVESLLEQLVETGRVFPDNDGDYPLKFGSAQYFVLIDPGPHDDPVVRVFATALANVEPSPELYEQLNEINRQLKFTRTFWVREQVLIETEMHWEALSSAGFKGACRNVAVAADYFGPLLASAFGGETAFGNEKGEDYETSVGWYPGYL
jgi:hypothetical protein